MKVISPQLGFNNNVRHKGRVFHIQTEDSGLKHPHIITHLFADGGRILKSTKTSYAEFLEVEELPKKIRQLMQEQHKAMFIALRGGKFDHLVGDIPPEAGHGEGDKAREPLPSTVDIDVVPQGRGSLSGAAAGATAPPAPAPSAPGVAAPPPAEPAPEPSPEATPAAPTAPAAPAAAAPAEPRPPQPSVPPRAPLASEPPPPSKPRLVPPPPRGARPTPPAPAPAAPEAVRPSVPGFRNVFARGPSDSRAPQPRAPLPSATSESPRPHRAPMSASLDLDLEALERAAEQPQAPVISQVRDLPPPPSAVRRPPVLANTSYRSVTPQATQIVTEPRAPAPSPSRPGQPSGGAAAAGRYAPSRPAAIFGNAKPQEGSSIFGEDLISEKSLDEVILSYLAEDLEGPPPKK